jgi:hypothetical protein
VRSASGNTDAALRGYAVALARAPLARAPLAAATRRTYASKIRGYLTWLASADVDGDPLGEPQARDWAVRDYRNWLVTVAKRAPATRRRVRVSLLWRRGRRRGRPPG